MKLFRYFFLLFILSFSSLFAQEGFYYQAVIKNPDGSPLKETQVAVKISIVSNTTTLYTEQRSIDTSKEGFISFIIGENDPASFSGINWNQELFLEDQIDINDGQGFSTPSRMPLLKSPRAYVADRAVNIYSKDGVLILNSGDTGTKATFTGNLLDSAGGTIIDNTAGSVALNAATLSGNLTGDVTGNVTGNAETATALETARTIGGVSFDGTANIDLPGVNTAGNQNTSGNAATATKIASITNSQIVQLDATQILTNKTLSNPTITGATVSGTLTGNVTGDLYASDGTSIVLDSGTDGNDATFTGDVTGDLTGDVTGQVSIITNHINSLGSADNSLAEEGVGSSTYSSTATIATGLLTLSSFSASQDYNAGINLLDTSVVILTPISPAFNNGTPLLLIVSGVNAATDKFTVESWDADTSRFPTADVNFYFMAIK